MSTRTLLILQSIMSGLHIVNISIATQDGVPKWVSIGLSAVMASLQVLLQNTGNNTEPAPAPQPKPANPSTL